MPAEKSSKRSVPRSILFIVASVILPIGYFRVVEQPRSWRATHNDDHVDTSLAVPHCASQQQPANTSRPARLRVAVLIVGAMRGFEVTVQTWDAVMQSATVEANGFAHMSFDDEDKRLNRIYWQLRRDRPNFIKGLVMEAINVDSSRTQRDIERRVTQTHIPSTQDRKGLISPLSIWVSR